MWTKGWRNLESARISIGEKVTVLFGGNGEGKSNLLEAVGFGIAFRSFRTSSVREAVQWGCGRAELELRIVLKGVEHELRVELEEGRRRSWMDGKSIRRDSERLGGASVVVFSPEELRIPRGPASERRKFLDRVVFGVCRPYAQEASAYERALRSRNRLLRERKVGGALMESCEEVLARSGAKIVVRRREVSGELDEEFRAAFSRIHSDGAVGIRYRSRGEMEGSGEEELYQWLRRSLEEGRRNDERRGFTGVGPQNDDMELFFLDRLAKEHGSQGQMRSMVLALKLAELAYLEKKNGESPILLLDDVGSELDVDRRNLLYEAVSSLACQTIVSGTEREQFPVSSSREDWRVESGRLERSE